MASPRGGLVHVVKVKVENPSPTILTGARLSIVNLNPAHFDQRAFLLKENINLDAGEHVFVNIASHPEGVQQDLALMSLQLPHFGGFYMPNGYGIVTGEHRFDLCLTREDRNLVEIRCRLRVDGEGSMRLDKVD